ncbi:MAG: hypothetical protein HYU63_07365 [Armatimonadetes bacterium]|nr:hypothetical protein [Armatimonadota bacterium]
MINKNNPEDENPEIFIKYDSSGGVLNIPLPVYKIIFEALSFVYKLNESWKESR